MLTGKKVVDIQTHEFGVKVISADSDVYEGDIVIGADGVNSTVRRHMWDEVALKSPTQVQQESTGNNIADPTHLSYTDRCVASYVL